MDLFPSAEQTLKDIAGEMNEFCVFQLIQNMSPDQIHSLSNEYLKVNDKVRSAYQKFGKDLAKMAGKRPQVEENVVKLLKSVNSGNLS